MKRKGEGYEKGEKQRAGEPKSLGDRFNTVYMVKTDWLTQNQRGCLNTCYSMWPVRKSDYFCRKYSSLLLRKSTETAGMGT